ncbi:MAG: TetR/AcrR family transcriptional regulator [Pseudomonadota bacterium]
MSEKTSAKRPSFHHGDLRAQLIRAVRQLVETKGADGFSIAEAARVAGVSSGAPYKHFVDRPDLLRAVAVDGLNRLRERMTLAAAKQNQGALTAITAIGVAYVAFAKDQPGVFRLIFGLTDGHEKSDDLKQAGERTFAVLLNAVAEHVKEGPSSPAVQETAYLMWTHVHGHAFLSIDGKRREEKGRPDDSYYVERACRGALASHKS